LLTGIDDPDQRAGYPFHGPGVLVRAVPFAVIAALAEASLVLTPGAIPAWPAWISLVLLLATAAAFTLPWERLPSWLSVFVPLTYIGSVLALILAAGDTAGVGIILLAPLAWTALFQRRWESGCVILAITVVEAITSLTPVAAPSWVISRRVVLWATLSIVIAVATHGLREREIRARTEANRLHGELTELTLMRDRDRIAVTLQDSVVQRVHTAGMSLYSAAALTTQPEVRARVLAAAEGLDDVVRVTRDAIFAPGQRPRGRGLRAEIVALCEALSPVPEISFRGPVDSAIDPVRGEQILRTLRTALETIIPHTTPSHVAITTGDTSCSAEIETSGLLPEIDRSKLENRTAASDIGLAIQPGSDGTRLTWSIPLA
jgi:signal transduction histidine kinase